MNRSFIERNLLLYHELSQVLIELRKENIPVIVLKGAHLAELVYGDISLRTMGDLDLLVRMTDLANTAKLLLEMGYNMDIYSTVEEAIQTIIKAKSRVIKFTKLTKTTNMDVTIEIHRAIESFLLRPKEVDGLWKRARNAVIAGANVQVLSHEDLLLHLCIHGSFHHKFERGLQIFCDVRETIQQYQHEIDWDQLCLRAFHWRCRKYVYLVLYLTRELLGTPVPDNVLNTIKPDDFNHSMIILSREEILNFKSDSALPGKGIVQLWKHKHFRNKAIFLLRTIFPPRETIAQVYSISPYSPRICLYYLSHLKSLLHKHGPMMWRRGFKGEKISDLVERKNRRTELLHWLRTP